MKKIWITLMALFLIFCVSACGMAGQSSDSETQQVGNSRQAESSTSLDNSESAKTSAQTDNESESAPTEKNDETEFDTAMKMNVQIGDKIFTATLEDNAAVRELIEMMRQAPVSIDMSDYSGFEKVGFLGRNLTTDNHQITTGTGDIVLYNGNQIVMFYGSNSWSYTKIGRIDDLTGWEDVLGSGGITAVFTIAE